MLTPQEVSNRAFTKAPFNGYNMTMVDEFLDELTDDYTALYKENAALKAKMKVMVEKVEEYRATEDSMRSALLAAQKMAASIVEKAEAKRDEILADADREAHQRTDDAQREAESLEERIRIGRRDMARFIAASRELCNKELSFLEQLPQIQVDTGEPIPLKAGEPEYEETVLDGFNNMEEKARTAFSGIGDREEEPAPPAADEAEETRRVRNSGRRFKLEELKLGRKDREEARRVREEETAVIRLAGEEA